MKKIILSLMTLLLITQSAQATLSGIGISRGFSGVDGMNGYMINGHYYWGSLLKFQNDWEFTGLWNTSLDYWQTNRARDTAFSNLTMLSLSPVLRFQRAVPYTNTVSPYIDGGYGLGVMNRNQFSGQQLGGYVTFVLSIGVGILFGDQSQYSLGYHYLNYNNASNLNHDDGLYVNTIDFSYRFAQT